MLNLYKVGYNFELSKEEDNYIKKIIYKEQEEKRKEELEEKRIAKLKEIEYDAAMMEDYFSEGEGAGICLVDYNLFNVGDVVVDDNGKVMKIAVKWSVDAYDLETGMISRVVRKATSVDIDNATNKKNEA